jgi:Kelch motif protein
VVFGGWGDLKKKALDSVVAYTPRTGSWRSLPPLLIATAAAGAATVRTRDGFTHLYVVGGLPDFTSVQEYSLPPGGKTAGVHGF